MFGLIPTSSFQSAKPMTSRALRNAGAQPHTDGAVHLRQTLSNSVEKAAGLETGAGVGQVAEMLGGTPGLLVYGPRSLWPGRRDDRSGRV